VLGGCQSLHTNGRDEALALPSEASARLALRTQQVIAHESGVATIADPLGGSWAVEKLTDELEERADAYLRRVDELGGMVAAVAAGYPQREIEEAAWRYQKDVELKRRVIVGVNAFQTDERTPFELLRLDPSLEQRQKERLSDFRRRRDSDGARRATDALREAAKGDVNLVPLMVAAVQAGATLGEISDALRDVFGEHRAGA